MLGSASLAFGSSATMAMAPSGAGVVTNQHSAPRKAFSLQSNHRRKPLKLDLVSGICKRESLVLSLVLSGTTSFKTAVASVDSDQISSSDATDKQQKNKYYFLVANAKFMLDEEEHFQEQLSERLRLFGERNIELDFWLVVEPKFLDKFPNITKRLRRPAVALVSTNGTWITFMKLRLDRVLSESFEADSVEEALASNPTNLEFEKPENWVAPYKKYESGWWERFLPPKSE